MKSQTKEWIKGLAREFVKDFIKDCLYSAFGWAYKAMQRKIAELEDRKERAEKQKMKAKNEKCFAF